MAHTNLIYHLCSLPCLPLKPGKVNNNVSSSRAHLTKRHFHNGRASFKTWKIGREEHKVHIDLRHQRQWKCFQVNSLGGYTFPNRILCSLYASIDDLGTSSLNYTVPTYQPFIVSFRLPSTLNSETSILVSKESRALIISSGVFLP